MNIIATLTHYKALKAQMDSIKEELDSIKSDVIDYMASNDCNGKMTVGQYTVTITECTKTSLDEKAIRERFPDIAKEYERKTVYDRFVVK